jgi:LmbE family N-acetylglucosaminyl deacetylase
MTVHLVVSPHPDDAIWSLGGRIAAWRQAGASCAVVTVFDGAGTTPAEGWRAIADPAARVAEDRAALAVLSCERVSLGLPDAALRTSDTSGGYRYAHPHRLFGPPHAEDEALVGLIAERLRSLLTDATIVHGPLGAGRHVDHRLTRLAVESLEGVETCWYEEFPYPLRAADHRGLIPRVEALEAAHVEAWFSAAQQYRSQVEALCGGPAGLRDGLRERVTRHAADSAASFADRQWVPPRPNRTRPASSESLTASSEAPTHRRSRSAC